MTRRYVLLALLLMGGVFVTNPAWAASSTAIQQWKAECDKGSADGCFNLGLMYATGQGVKQDFFQAVDLYRKACDGGSAAGCLNLGGMYQNGQGVKQDFFQAVDLYCVFRPKPATDSDASRPPIPTERGH
ncbi:MAG: sel1 repeat family protein [Nitrospira sp.]|nr:sel1 repeat family protein [Nitrospira sp.]